MSDYLVDGINFELVDSRQKFLKKHIGECIYCGSKENLSDEHALPYALGGTIILQKASCETCRKVVEKFEVSVLRSSLWKWVRAKYNLPSRNPDKMPKYLPFVILKDGIEKEIRLPVNESPLIVTLLEFYPPSRLDGRSVEETGIWMAKCHFIYLGGPPISDILRKLGAEYIQSQIDYAPEAFARMIAKIGFCFAVLEHGLSFVRNSPVINSILTGREISRWVGSYGGMQQPLSPTHFIHCEDVFNHEQGWFGVILRFFANYMSPNYLVVLKTFS